MFTVTVLAVPKDVNVVQFGENGVFLMIQLYSKNVTVTEYVCKLYVRFIGRHLRMAP